MIYIDFDMTLYNTEEFVKDICTIFHRHGVPLDIAYEAKEKAVNTDVMLHFDYTFERHIAAVQSLGHPVETELVLKELRTLLTDTYVFEGAIEFITTLKQSGHTITLLTAGNADFQRSKVQGSGINIHVHQEVYIPGGKDVYVHERMVNEKTFFINDNGRENVLVKKMNPEVCVVTKLNPAKNYAHILQELDIPIYSTFEEILSYVNSH